jgi:RNA polymerase sigma-70 factor (ECF subfamily)
MKHPVLDSDVFGDETLMDELIRQESRALETLYVRHRPVLRGVVLRVLGDEIEVDDVLQEVFVQLWTRANDYSPRRGKPLGWLITLARRRAIDRLRQRTAYQRATDRFESEVRHPLLELGYDAHSVEGAAARADMRALLHGALQRLPEKQRMVVERAFLDGLTQREIAADLHLPLGTVKTRIELGLRKLGSVLAGSRRKIF